MYSNKNQQDVGTKKRWNSNKWPWLYQRWVTHNEQARKERTTVGNFGNHYVTIDCETRDEKLPTNIVLLLVNLIFLGGWDNNPRALGLSKWLNILWKMEARFLTKKEQKETWENPALLGWDQRYQVVSEKGRREGERHRIQCDVSVCASVWSVCACICECLCVSVCASVSVRVSLCVHIFPVSSAGRAWKQCPSTEFTQHPVLGF